MPKAKRTSSRSPSPSRTARKGRARATRRRADAEGALQQVRELLFGVEVRELQERTTRELTALRTEVRRRLAGLQQRQTRELRGLATRLRALARRVTAAGRASDTALARQRRAAEQGGRDVLARAHAEVAELRAELQAALAAMQERVAAQLQAIQQDKTDRSALASLFEDFAQRVGGGNHRRG